MENENMGNDVQQRYIELQMLEKQIIQAQKQIQSLENQIIEINIIKQGLGDLETKEKDTEILTPISNGIFVKATLKDNNTLLVNVGANIVVEKNIEDTKKLLDHQLEEIKKFQARLISDFQKMNERMLRYEKELNELISE